MIYTCTLLNIHFININIHHYNKKKGIYIYIYTAMPQLEMPRHSGYDLQTPILFSDVH